MPTVYMMPNGTYLLGRTSDSMPNTASPSHHGHSPTHTPTLGHFPLSTPPFGSYSKNVSIADAPLHSTPPFGSYSKNVSIADAPLHSTPPFGSYSKNVSLADAPLHPTPPFGPYSHNVSNVDVPVHPTPPFGSHFTNVSNVYAPLHANASYGSHFDNVSYSHTVLGSTASFGSPFVNQPHTVATVSPTSETSFGSPYGNYSTDHPSNPSFGLPNGDHPYAAASHMANGSFGFANSVSSMELGDNAVPSTANTTSSIYLPEHTATLPTCDTCNVLSAFNEPSIDSDSTSVHDMDPDSHTDSMIPRIDALLDIDRVGDSSQDKGPRAIVKEETELEEGEIRETDELTNATFNGVMGGPIDFAIIYKALTTLQSCAALDEQTTHVEDTRARSSTASTMSPRVMSPLADSFDNESVNVFYINPASEATNSNITEPAHPYTVTPPNSESRLSTIYEDEYMPSLAPSQTFIPESS
ncbi:hypothetical protein EDD22DRAFT_856024, partial [Suillus occidentalis]